VKANID